MAASIYLFVESKVTPGKLDDLRSVIREVSAHCAATEPGMLQYDWFISEDGTEVRVLEEYTDSDAIRFHGPNYASFQPALGDCRTVQRITVLGPADDDLRSALADRGAFVFDSLATLPR